MRRARLKHDEFARSLATRLSIYLRLEVNIQVAELQTLAHPRFIEGLANPSHFTLFRIEPLTGLGVLVVPLRLSFAIVNRMLGGPGDPDNPERTPSEIEVALLDLVTALVLKEWCQTVAASGDAQPQILGHETNPRFLPTSSNEAQLLHLSLETRLGEAAEPLQLAFPFGMVETLLQNLDAAAQVRKASPPRAQAAAPKWHPGLDEVPVPVSAGWDDLQLTTEQFAHLKVGDVLPLEPQRFNQVLVRLARVSKFVGRLGSADQTRAVELSRPIPPAEAVQI